MDNGPLRTKQVAAILPRIVTVSEPERNSPAGRRFIASQATNRKLTSKVQPLYSMIYRPAFKSVL